MTHCGAVLRTLGTQSGEPGFGPGLPCRRLASSFILRCLSPLIGMNEHLAIDNGCCVYTNCLLALSTAWLDASQRSQGGARWNRQSSLSPPETGVSRQARITFYLHSVFSGKPERVLAESLLCREDNLGTSSLTRPRTVANSCCTARNSGLLRVFYG